MVLHMTHLGSRLGILTYPCPRGVELVSEHTSGEPKTLSEVPCMLLGWAWHLDFLGVSSFVIGLSPRTMQLFC